MVFIAHDILKNDDFSQILMNKRNLIYQKNHMQNILLEYIIYQNKLDTI